MSFFSVQNLDVCLSLTSQNIKMRFERSKLGLLWYFIEPVLFIAIFYFVFSNIMVSHIDQYVFYLCAGIIPWIFFSASVQDASRCLIERQHFIRNTVLDLRVIPLSTCLAHALSFMISLAILFIILACAGSLRLEWSLLLLVPLIIIQLFFCYGICLLFAILSVMLRDVLYSIPLVMMLCFYATPIFYTVEMVPRRLRWVVDYNPMRYFIDLYRTLILGRGDSAAAKFILLVCVAAVSFVVGTVVFRKNSANLIKKL